MSIFTQKGGVIIISLKEKYLPYFKIGAAVSRRTIRTHADLLTKHFNSLTCENEMKYASVYTKNGDTDFTGADAVYAFALEHGMALRGHTLVWHNQTPAFAFKENDREGTIQGLEEHMRHMAARYDQGVYAWDVVNEAIEDKEDTYLRDTKWLAILGEDYISEVFATARRIFPGKDLYYNDYNETNATKRGKIIKLITLLKERGVPIDGVGLQAHYNIYTPTVDEIKKSLEQYAALGLKISITEMDVSVFRFEDHTQLPAPTAELIERQAEFYRQCFAVYREYAAHIDSVTLWGVADDATWLDHFPARGRKNWPLLFDEEHNPKEAFRRIIEF